MRNARQAVGVADSYYTTTSDYGDETHYWHGVDFVGQRPRCADRCSSRPAPAPAGE